MLSGNDGNDMETIHNKGRYEDSNQHKIHKVKEKKRIMWLKGHISTKAKQDKNNFSHRLLLGCGAKVVTPGKC